MVTTAERPTQPFATSSNPVAAWAQEYGLRQSGRWEDPEPVPVDVEAAYAAPDHEPASQMVVIGRSAQQRANAIAAVAAITGLDIDMPEEIVVPVVLPYAGVTVAHEPAHEREPSRWRAKDTQWRAERGIVRKHTKLAPSKTTKGRRDAYLRSLVTAGKFATVDDADKATPRRPRATRYGRERRERAMSPQLAT